MLPCLRQKRTRRKQNELGSPGTHAIPFGAAIAVGSIGRVGVDGKVGDRVLVSVEWVLERVLD